MYKMTCINNSSEIGGNFWMQKPSGPEFITDWIAPKSSFTYDSSTNPSTDGFENERLGPLWFQTYPGGPSIPGPASFLFDQDVTLIANVDAGTIDVIYNGKQSPNTDFVERKNKVISKKLR
jgi:hypothetical protein